MSVPVVGSLVVSLVYAFVVPHYLWIAPCEVLQHWSIKPSQSFFAHGTPRAGLAGISKVPRGCVNRTCDCCGAGFESDELLFEWRPNDSTPDHECYAVHDNCMVGYSTLFGADYKTLEQARRLYDEFGPLFKRIHPVMFQALGHAVRTLQAFCEGWEDVERAVKRARALGGC